jgi:excisionase family DNA binding protein
VSALQEHVEGPGRESIRALATVTLDARALDSLGSRSIDRLADLVAARLAERREVAEAPLLTTAGAARVAGVHPETVRRAIRTGLLEVAGYVGKRPRLRRSDVEFWVAAGQAPEVRGRVSTHGLGRVSRARRGDASRVLGDTLRAIQAASAEGGAS